MEAFPNPDLAGSISSWLKFLIKKEQKKTLPEI